MKSAFEPIFLPEVEIAKGVSMTTRQWEAAANVLTRERHPDRGGSGAIVAKLSVARAAALSPNGG